jgi:hypothetical protein
MADTVRVAHAEVGHGAENGDTHAPRAHPADRALHEPAAGHGHGPDEAGEPLGSIDVVAWAYAAAGAAIGLVTALALFVASAA